MRYINMSFKEYINSISMHHTKEESVAAPGTGHISGFIDDGE